MIASLFITLQFVTQLIPAILLYFLPIVDDIVIKQLIVLFIGQLLGTVVVYLIIIRFVKVKNVEFNSMNKESLTQTLVVVCLLCFGLIFLATTSFFLSSIFQLEISESMMALPITSDHISNLLTNVLCLAAFTFGSALFVEYLFRRTLIPLLEVRGMAPLMTVLFSSFVYAISHTAYDLGLRLGFLEEWIITLHSRYDQLNTLSYAISQFNYFLLLGLACGTIYILTRNIIYPILVHTFGRFIFIMPNFLSLLNNDLMSLIFSIIIFLVYIIGLSLGIYLVWKLLYHPYPEWLTILRKKSNVRIRRGICGFLFVFMIITAYLALTPFSSTPIMITALLHILAIPWFAWMIYRSSFDPNYLSETKTEHVTGDVI